MNVRLLGGALAAACRAGYVIASLEIRAATYVELIVLRCRLWDATARHFTGGDIDQIAYGNQASGAGRFVSQCEFAIQPMVGIRGRTGNLVDAIGILCDER